MEDLFSSVVDVAVVVFSVTSMLSVGFGNSVAEIVAPLRGLGGLVRALVANFVLVPLLAFVVVRLLSLDRPFEIGMILVSVAAGAPFLIKLTEAAAGPVRLSATLLVILLPATIVVMPLVVPLLVPEAVIRAGSIALPLVLMVLLPFVAGLLVRERRPGWALGLLPLMSRTSTVALVVLVLATLLANLRAIAGLVGEGVILASLLVVGGAFVIGYALGPDPDRRDVLGLGTGQRNIAAATVVATQSFDNPRTVVTVVVFSLAGFAVLFPAAALLRRRQAARHGTG